MDGWMGGWMDGWMDGCVGERRQMDGWIDSQMNRGACRQMCEACMPVCEGNGWMDQLGGGWMNGLWVDGSMSAIQSLKT